MCCSSGRGAGQLGPCSVQQLAHLRQARRSAWPGPFPLLCTGPRGQETLGTGVPQEQQQLCGRWAFSPSPVGRDKSTHESVLTRKPESPPNQKQNLSLHQIRNRFHVASGTNNFSGTQLCIYTMWGACDTAGVGGSVVWEVTAPTLLRMGPTQTAVSTADRDFLSGRPGAKGTTRRTSQQSVLHPCKHPAVLSTALSQTVGSNPSYSHQSVKLWARQNLGV